MSISCASINYGTFSYSPLKYFTSVEPLESGLYIAFINILYSSTYLNTANNR